MPYSQWRHTKLQSEGDSLVEGPVLRYDLSFPPGKLEVYVPEAYANNSKTVLQLQYSPAEESLLRQKRAHRQWVAFTLLVIAVFAFTYAASGLTRQERIEVNNQEGLYSSVGITPSSFFTVKRDLKTGEFQVFISPDDSTPYAAGSYLKNVDSNGWNHLSVHGVLAGSKGRPSVAAYVVPPMGSAARGAGSDSSTSASSSSSSFSSAPSQFNEQRQGQQNEELLSMLAMGFLEGYVTCNEMRQWYVNFYSGLFDGGDPMDPTLDFLETNHDWMVQQAESQSRDSEYWMAVRGTLAQLHGMLAGVRAACPGVATEAILGLARAHSESENQGRTKSTENEIFLEGSTSPLPILALLGLSSGDKNGAGGEDMNARYMDRAGVHPPRSEDTIVLGDDDGDDDYTQHTRKGVYLPTLRRHPCLIHLLLMNANGDLYQIAEKFNQQDAPPSEGPDGSGEEQENAGDVLGTVVIGKRSSRGSNRLGHGLAREHVRPRNSSSSSSSATIYRQHNGPSTKGRGGARSTGVDHCSALIKLLPDRSDVLFGHNTWDDYQCAFPRIFKRYQYRHLLGGADGTETWGHSMWFDVHFSSSPGLLSSVDDFYIVHSDPEAINGFGSEFGKGKSDTDNRKSDREYHKPVPTRAPTLVPSSFPAPSPRRLAIIETTLDIYNKDLLDAVQPHAMLAWVRARAANQLATDGAHWADIFSNHSAGTYANQWMVLDLTRFTPGSDPKAGFLTVLEEVPGYARWEDETNKLLAAQEGTARTNGDSSSSSSGDNINSYWASYNNPYFDDIAVMSGNADLCLVDSNACHYSDPRARIFREQQWRVRRLGDIQGLMGYNRFATDAQSSNNSCNAIACRQDLEPAPIDRYPFGAIDAKVSSAILAQHRPLPVVFARLGPSTSSRLPPFCWSQFEGMRNGRGRRYSHAGHPECFDFDWQVMPPRGQAEAGEVVGDVGQCGLRLGDCAYWD